jgi:uncharacterized membrane protein
VSGVLIAILCGLLAAIAWGIADFFAAKASRSVGPALSVAIVNTIGLLGFAIFFVVTGQAWSITNEGLWFAIAAGIAQGLAQVVFFQALNDGPVSLVSPISSAFPLFTTIAVMAFFGASLSAPQLGGVAIIMVGVLIASDLVGSLRYRQGRIGRGPQLALVVAVLWGLAFAFLAQSIETVGWQVASLVQLVFVAGVCVAALPIIKGKEPILIGANLTVFKNPFVISTGIIQMFGLVIISVGLEKGANLAPAVTAVSACYPVLTILLALAHFKEAPKLLPLSGAAITIAGVIVLSLNG